MRVRVCVRVPAGACVYRYVRVCACAVCVYVSRTVTSNHLRVAFRLGPSMIWVRKRPNKEEQGAR